MISPARRRELEKTANPDSYKYRNPISEEEKKSIRRRVRNGETAAHVARDMERSLTQVRLIAKEGRCPAST